MANSTSADKGGIVLTDPVTETQATCRISAVTDATGYVKVAVSGHGHASETSFADALAISFQFSRTGNAGEGDGDVVGPAGGVVDGEIVLYDGVTGKLIKGSGGATLGDYYTAAALNAGQLDTRYYTEAEIDADFQPIDADLTAIAALSGTGLAVRTAADTWALRSLVAGDGLTGSDLDGVAGNPSLAVGAGTEIAANADDVAIDKASDANVYSAAADKVLTADHIESASASVALTDAATIAFDWDAGINRHVTLGGNRTLGNPTNGQPGTWRTFLFTQDGTGNRTLSFGAAGAWLVKCAWRRLPIASWKRSTGVSGNAWFCPSSPSSGAIMSSAPQSGLRASSMLVPAVFRVFRR